jgi:hypothetical protein
LIGNKVFCRRKENTKHEKAEKKRNSPREEKREFFLGSRDSEELNRRAVSDFSALIGLTMNR